MFQSTCVRASTERASRSFAHALSCSIAWVGGASSLQGDAGSRGESKLGGGTAPSSPQTLRPERCEIGAVWDGKGRSARRMRWRASVPSQRVSSQRRQVGGDKMAQEDEQQRSRRGTSEVMPVDTLPQKVQLECSKFLARLRRHQVPHALDVARKTLEIMRLVVATSGAKDLGGLIALIKQAGQILVSAQPHELVIGNMVRRVLYIVREETREQALAPEGGAAQSSSATSGGRSLHRILEAPPDAPDYSELPAKNLKAPILEVLNEVVDEL